MILTYNGHAQQRDVGAPGCCRRNEVGRGEEDGLHLLGQSGAQIRTGDGSMVLGCLANGGLTNGGA